MNNDYVNTGRINQKLETRSKILDSAKYFLNKRDSFNLEDVAEHTGISRATIYRYFSNVELLASEAVLDLSTKKPETLYEDLKGKSIEDMILGVQDYFNLLAIDHEAAFRKYLSTTLSSDSTKIIRGARRKKTLQLILETTKLSNKEKDNIANLLTILMGIEPLIITKDVCGLDSRESKLLMRSGMELILKSLFK